jgi:YgiT-type zinc finger domain-containing protein
MNKRDPICPACHFGKLNTQTTTYTQVYHGQFIVIPNVPTLVCDVCGEKVFDRETLSRLSGLLGQSRAHTRNVSPRHSWP